MYCILTNSFEIREKGNEQQHLHRRQRFSSCTIEEGQGGGEEGVRQHVGHQDLDFDQNEDGLSATDHCFRHLVSPSARIVLAIY